MALDRPKRRTYVTGQSLDALTTSFKLFPLGPNEADEHTGAVRAFTVNIRNRSSTSKVYIREGNDADEIEIQPHEHYPIYEPNGIQNIQLKGESGGEKVEIRVLLAHNDFSIQDKIDGFLRSLSSYVGTATRDTRITDSDIDIPVSIDAQTATLNTDTQITGSDVNIPTSIEATNVTVPTSLEADNVGGIDMNLTGSSVSQDVDITAQTVGDISVLDIEGQNHTEMLADGSSDMSTTETWTFISNSNYDGFFTDLHNRAFDGSAGDMTTGGRLAVYLEVDQSSIGLWRPVTPEYATSTRAIYEQSRSSQSAYVQRFAPERECVWGWEPELPIKFQSGDSLRLVIEADGKYPSSTSPYNIESTVQYTLRVGT